MHAAGIASFPDCLEGVVGGSNPMHFSSGSARICELFAAEQNKSGVRTQLRLCK